MHCYLRSHPDRGSLVIRQVAMAAMIGLLAGCQTEPPASDPPAKSPPTAADPQTILLRMIDTYAAADDYADRGRIRLRYRQHGRWYEDEAPLAVVKLAANRLRVDAYQTTVVCDGEQFFARIRDAATDDLDGQVLVQPAPAEISLPAIFRDPVLRDALTSGLGRQPVQLELLLASRPLDTVVRNVTPKRMLPEQKQDGHDCYRVEATTTEGPFVFWIDQRSSILRRLDYPVRAMVPELEADGIREAQLIAEFRGARMDRSVGEQSFRFDIPAEAKQVHTFVLPPQPLPSQLLGKRPGDFSFIRPAGGEVNRHALSGKMVVLVWFNNHPACRAALEQLDEVYQSYRDRGVTVYAVCTEPSHVSHQQLEQMLVDWGIEVPLIRDLRAVGRDLFRIPGAPTLVLLDAHGTVQVFEVGANPRLAANLAIALDRLLAGDNLAADILAHHERERQDYQRRLELARDSATTFVDLARSRLAPPSEPARLQRDLLWTCNQLQRPGNITVVKHVGGSPVSGSPRIFVIDDGRRVVELNPGGSVISRHELATADQISFLQSQADRQDQRFFVVGSLFGEQVRVFDARWRPVLTYPAANQRRDPIFDARVADIDSDGKLELLVGFLGKSGVHCVGIDGQLKWLNTSLPAPLSMVITRSDQQPRSLLVSGQQGLLMPIDGHGQQRRPIQLEDRAIFHLFAGASETAAGFCGLTYNDAGGLVAVGLDERLREQWAYPLPAGSFAVPVQFVTTGQLDGSRDQYWVIAAPDATIHVVAHDGGFSDKFGFGEAVTGIAMTRIDERPVLLVAAQNQISAWRIELP